MNLTAALALLGAAVLLALALHGWWRMRRIAPRVVSEMDTVPAEPERVERPRSTALLLRRARAQATPCTSKTYRSRPGRAGRGAAQPAAA
ncbi:MAG: hypothetical protein U1F49_04910 [Rubrivivax sp.]